MVTSHPLKPVLHNPNATGAIAKWAAELAEFELKFKPRLAVKSQALVDFVAYWTPSPSCPGTPECDESPEKGLTFTEPHWTLFFDGSSRRQSAGAEVLVLALDEVQVKYMVQLRFRATNNMAEYEALIYGLAAALSLGVQQLLVRGDSQLIIKQVKRECNCNDPQLAAYLIYVQKLEKEFEVLEFQHIRRTQLPMSYRQRRPLGPRPLMEFLKEGYYSLQLILPRRLKGAKSAPRS